MTSVFAYGLIVVEDKQSCRGALKIDTPEECAAYLNRDDVIVLRDYLTKKLEEWATVREGDLLIDTTKDFTVVDARKLQECPMCGETVPMLFQHKPEKWICSHCCDKEDGDEPGVPEV